MDLRGIDESLPLAITDPAGSVAPLRGAPGQVLAGKYELVREIGRGGMGVVWLAERLDWGRAPVAVKLMVPTLDSPASRIRFHREAQTAVKLRSTHVVQVLDHGIDEQADTPFLVMELLEGESLRGRLERLKVLSPAEVMLVVSHLGRALMRASRFHVVHRDLKPENVFLAENGDEPCVKVLDFGLAKAFDTSMTIDSRALTIPGNVVGTPWYMSPEQIRRADPDHRGDLWSLAVITFECLVGRRPFGASDLGALATQMFIDERPVPSRSAAVPPGFDDWFATATHHDLEQRFQSAEELVDALAGVCGSSRKEIPRLEYERHSPPRTSSLDPVTRPSEMRPFSSRRATLLFSGIGGLVLGVGAIYLSTRANFLNRPASVAPLASATATQALTPIPASAPPVALPPGPIAGAVHEPVVASGPLQTGTASAFAEAPARAAPLPAEAANNAPVPPVVPRAESTKPVSRSPKGARQRRRSTPPAPDNDNTAELDGRNYRTDL